MVDASATLVLPKDGRIGETNKDAINKTDKKTICIFSYFTPYNFIKSIFPLYKIVMVKATYNMYIHGNVKEQIEYNPSITYTL